MQNEIIINADPGETRVALIERSVFTELHIERELGKSVVGNIVKGRVSRVLPGMQAAFVDIGLDKAAFLYVGDYFANTADENGEAPPPPRRRGRNGGRNQPPKIETVLKEGQEIVVQIAKEPIGTKGARITSNISIPGRHLVLTPWSRRVGVSRRIDSDKERKRLREIVDRLRPKDLGFIIRTAGDGVRDADLEADIRYLETIWKKIQLANVEKKAPAVLHAEHDLSLRIIRDLANGETKRIVIDSPEAFASITEFVDEFVADPKPTIEHYEGALPVFDKFDLESQIHANLGRKVWLKSGGSLIVDQSEALTAIDVNTGRFVGKRDLEETVFKTNLEAVKEVVNQLRFRNIGGLIIIDLIDMESADHREKTYRALQEALRSDKSRTNILKISELGLVEMTRKRTRENLVQTLCEPCAYCEGRGYVLSGETVAYNILREIRMDLPRFCGRQIAVTVSPRVAEQLLGAESKPLATLSEQLGREIEIRARPGLHQEQFEVQALDEGPAVEIPLRWLRSPEEIAAEDKAKADEKNEAKKNGKRRGSRRRSRGPKDGDGGDETSDDDGGAEAVAEGAEALAATAEAAESSADAIPAPADGSDGKPKLAAHTGDSETPARATSPGSPGGSGEAAAVEEMDASAEEADAGSHSERVKPAPLSAQPLDDATEKRILPRSDESGEGTVASADDMAEAAPREATKPSAKTVKTETKSDPADPADPEPRATRDTDPAANPAAEPDAAQEDEREA
jgi:ribonuclease G